MARTEAMEVAWWADQIEKAIQAKKKWAKSDDWDRWEDCYLGKFNAKVPVNYFFAFARALIPQTYFRNPAVSVTPRRPETATQARTLESVLNWTIQEIALKREIKKAIFDTYLKGTGILKIGYDSEYGFTQDNTVGEVVTAEGVPLDLTDETVTGRNPKDFTKIEYNANVQPGMPWVLRVNPREFVIDPAATMIEDAAWCAHRIVRRLEDVKADVKYDKSATRDLKANLSKEFKSIDETRMMAGDIFVGKGADADTARGEKPIREDDWVELWEIRDAKTQRILVIALDHDKYLRNEFDELQVDGLPYVSLVFNGNPQSFWGVPDAQVIYPQQLELNDIRARQQELRREAVKRYAVREGILKPTDKDKFLSEDTSAFIEIPIDVGNVGDAFKELMGTIPQDINAWSDVVVNDMQDMLGMGRNQMGQFDRGAQGGSGRRTATEASIVQQSAQLRIDERRDTVADALGLIMRKVAQLTFKFWQSPRVARIVGVNGAVEWVQYTGEELRGEYDFAIDPDDALPITKMQRRQDAITLYQSTAQNPVANPIEMLRYLLQQFDGTNPDTMIAPPPPPMPPGLTPDGVPPSEGAMPDANVPVPMPQMPQNV